MPLTSSTDKGMDKQFFRKLYEDHYTGLCYHGSKIINDLESVEDIVHEVFINLWEKRDTIEPDKSVKSYLYRSVTNRCFNYIRDHKKFAREADLEQTAETTFINSDNIENQELEFKIYQTIESLPEKCRQVFRFSRFEELKYREIAEKLNISIKTVEVQMSKALKTMRAELKDYLKVLILMMINIFG